MLASKLTYKFRPEVHCRRVGAARGGVAGGRQAETPTPPAAGAQAHPGRALPGGGPGLVATALQPAAAAVAASVLVALGHLHTHT